jgi:hypothetical protein
MIHSVTYYGFMKNIGLEAQRKLIAAFLPTELPRKVYPGLQEVHRWRDEDGRCAHAPKRASNNHTKFIQ